jgi:hypothetical protein
VQWHRALRLIFTNPRCTQLRLLAPLGPWYPTRPDSTKWFFYRSEDALVVRSRFTDELTQYPLETRGRRALYYLKRRGQVVTTLPPTSVPTCAPTEDYQTWRSTPGAGLNCVPASLRPPPPRTFADFVSALDPSLSALLSDVEILLPLDVIVQLLATSSTLTLVGD